MVRHAPQLHEERVHSQHLPVEDELRHEDAVRRRLAQPAGPPLTSPRDEMLRGRGTGGRRGYSISCVVGIRQTTQILLWNRMSGGWDRAEPCEGLGGASNRLRDETNRTSLSERRDRFARRRETKSKNKRLEIDQGLHILQRSTFILSRRQTGSSSFLERRYDNGPTPAPPAPLLLAL